MITTLVIIFLGLVALAGTLYFFKPKKPKKPGEVGGDSDNKWKVPQFAKDWWKGLDEESSPGQRFVLLCVVLLVGYAEYTFSKTPTEGGHVWIALILLLLAAMYKPPKSKVTWAFVILDLVILIAAAFLPGVAMMRTTSYEIAKTWSVQEAEKMACYEARLQKEPFPLPPGCLREKVANESVQQATRQGPRAVLETTTQVLSVTSGNFKKAETPYGARVIDKISGDCPQGCITQVEHDGYRLCETGNEWEVDRNGNRWDWGFYQNAPCMVTTIPGASSAVRYRERFLKLPNSDLHFPPDLIYVIYSFGASWGIDPLDKGFGQVNVHVTMTTM